MTPLEIVLGLLVLVLAAAAAWMGALRGRERAQRREAEGALAGARREAEAAAGRLGEAERRQARLEAELEGAREDAAEARGRADQSTERVVELSRALAQSRERCEALLRTLEERDGLEERFTAAFKGLTADALKMGREEFLAQAKPVFEAAKKEQAELVRPLGEGLAATREKLEAIEKARAEAFARLNQHIESVSGASGQLREETARLTRALSRPEIRGQYGEIQLRRVAELAGMASYCDFCEQASVRDSDGNLLRPDMIVSLPNSRVIAVDAKCNTYAYLEAVNAKDDVERDGHLERFARHVAEQAKKLADKKYWTQWEGSPEFVVMFVPGDHFVDAALQRRPELIDMAAQSGVILATPSTLIGLLRAVAVGWREHRLAEEAQELFALGSELHERAATAFKYVNDLGTSLRQSVERYNRLVGSIDSRMVPTLRKFEEAGARSGKELAEASGVDATPRLLDAAADGDAAEGPQE